MSGHLDAVGIEYAFAYLHGGQYGVRGKAWDADVWRIGDPRDVAKAISGAADAIEKRFSRIHLRENEKDAGGPAAKIDAEIRRLREIATDLSKEKSSSDVWTGLHSELMGITISAVASLLSMLEDRQ